MAAPGRCAPPRPHPSLCSLLTFGFISTKASSGPSGCSSVPGQGLWVSREGGRAAGPSHESRRLVGGCRPGTFPRQKVPVLQEVLGAVTASQPSIAQFIQRAGRNALPPLTQRATCPTCGPCLGVRMSALEHTCIPPSTLACPGAHLHAQPWRCHGPEAAGHARGGGPSMHRGARAWARVAGCAWGEGGGARACIGVAGHVWGGPGYAQGAPGHAWGVTWACIRVVGHVRGGCAWMCTGSTWACIGVSQGGMGGSWT